MHDRIPDEIISHILSYIDPDENLRSFQLVSKQHHRLANENLLWRYHCRHSFKHWAAEHAIQEKLKGKAADVDWKKLWLLRRSRNQRASHLLDSIIATKVNYGRNFEQLGLLGYDAKDLLIEQCQVSPSAEDFLARRYFAKAALGTIHRTVAIKEWFKFQSGAYVPQRLECALGAFEMFALDDGEGDIQDIQRALDNHAQGFLKEHPSFSELDTRRKALTLLHWARAHNLTGMKNPAKDYRNMRNCLIGYAVLDEEHDSLPLISCAIFCALAQRVGLRAECCALPAHVYVVVSAPSHAVDLNGRRDLAPEDSATPAREPDVMYIDPYQSDEEVPIQDLLRRLVEYGFSLGNRTPLMASPASALVIRTANNIFASHTHFERNPTLEASRAPFRSGEVFRKMQSLQYAVIWSRLLLTSPRTPSWGDSLAIFLELFVRIFPQDAWLVSQYAAPLYDAFAAANPATAASFKKLHRMLDHVRNGDAMPAEATRRHTPVPGVEARFRVGQVFSHKRYHYTAIINGWSTRGANWLPTPHLHETTETFTAEDYDFPPGTVPDNFGADDPDGDDVGGPAANGTARQPRPRSTQPFYTCMKRDEDRVVVSEDNIEVITDPIVIPDSLMSIAGKFFKRFDPETCTFVSNIKEFYPDD